MLKDKNCSYCMKDENPSLYEKFAIKLCELKVSTLYLFKEQSHKGRCVVAYKDHVSEITDLNDEELLAFFKDVQNASRAIHKAFNPNKVNYGAYGDTGHHLHIHLVPKYANDSFEWGQTFAMDPNKYKPDMDELNKIGLEIVKNLEK